MYNGDDDSVVMILYSDKLHFYMMMTICVQKLKNFSSAAYRDQSVPVSAFNLRYFSTSIFSSSALQSTTSSKLSSIITINIDHHNQHYYNQSITNNIISPNHGHDQAHLIQKSVALHNHHHHCKPHHDQNVEQNVDQNVDQNVEQAQHPIQHSVSQGPQDLAQLIASHPKVKILFNCTIIVIMVYIFIVTLWWYEYEKYIFNWQSWLRLWRLQSTSLSSLFIVDMSSTNQFPVDDTECSCEGCWSWSNTGLSWYLSSSL